MPGIEDISIRVHMTSNVARQVAEDTAALEAEQRQADDTNRSLSDQDMVTRNLARAKEEHRNAIEQEHAAQSSSDEDRLRAMRNTAAASDRMTVAQRENDRVVQAARADTDEHTRALGRNTDTIEKHTTTVDRDTNAHKRFSNAVRSMGMGLLTGIKWLGLFTAAGETLVPLLVSASTAVAGLGAAIAALSGVGVAAVGVLGGLVQGLLVGKLAVSGMGQAITDLASNQPDYEKIAQDMQDMPPAAQNAALALSDLVRGPWKQLKDDIQQNFFAQLSGHFGQLTGVVSKLTPVLSQTATTLGKIVASVIDMVSSARFMRDFQYNVRTNNMVLASMGQGVTALLQSFNRLYSYMRPFMLWFSNALTTGARHFQDWANSARGRNEIESFMQKAEVAGKRTWAIIKDLAVAIRNIIHIGSQTGVFEAMGAGIQRLVHQFREWTETGRGRNSIAEFFKEGYAVLKLLSPLATVVWTVLKELNRQGFLQTLVNVLNKQVLPLVVELVREIAQSGLLDALLRLIGAVAQFLGAFVRSGALKVVLALLTGLVDLFARILNIPIIGQITGIAIAFGLLAKAIPVGSIARFATGIGGMWSMIRSGGIVTNLATSGITKMGASVTQLGTRMSYWGRYGSTFNNATTKIGAGVNKAGGALTRFAGVAGKAAGGFAGGIAGFSIGSQVGSMVKDSSTGAKALGVLGGTAGGLAAGFAVGGPFGAAIGGAAGLIGGLVQVCHKSANAVDVLKGSFDDVNKSIEANNGLIDENIRKQQAQVLATKATLPGGAKVSFQSIFAAHGISPQMALGAMGMGPKAREARQAIVRQIRQESQRLANAIWASQGDYLKTRGIDKGMLVRALNASPSWDAFKSALGGVDLSALLPGDLVGSLGSHFNLIFANNQAIGGSVAAQARGRREQRITTAVGRGHFATRIPGGPGGTQWGRNLPGGQGGPVGRAPGQGGPGNPPRSATMPHRGAGHWEYGPMGMRTWVPDVAAPGNKTRWAGGPVFPDQMYLVGEKGFELLRTSKGMRPVGLEGPEYLSGERGTIIPNREAMRIVADASRESAIAAMSTRRAPSTVVHKGGDTYFPNSVIIARDADDIERRIKAMLDREKVKNRGRYIPWRPES